MTLQDIDVIFGLTKTTVSKAVEKAKQFFLEHPSRHKLLKARCKTLFEPGNP